MSFSYSELRAAVMEIVRHAPVNNAQVPDFGFLQRLESADRHLSDDDFETARQIFHDLYLEGIISPGTRARRGQHGGTHVMSWPFFVVTSYGKKVLATDKYEPHDSHGYISSLKQQAPGVDYDTIRYLEESLTCYRTGTLLASAVMLGCAAENVALLLIDAFGKSIRDSGDRERYEKETDSWMINSKYKALWKRLEPLCGDLPRPLRDNLHTVLDRVFDLIRTTRNSAGHPTGRTVEREEMRANFILFPGYCERVLLLVEHFGRTQN